MLSKIQAAINAPKSQRNEFGKYNYRSMSDINEAVKPILGGYGLALVVSDELVMIGERYYIKATASLIDATGVIVASAVGFAREEENKKGMDASQITGSCSSYARKYAANGLFAIDDTKDSDATNKHDKDEPPAKPAADTGSNDALTRIQSKLDTLTTIAALDAWEVTARPAIDTLPPTQKARADNLIKSYKDMILEIADKEADVPI